ncbi:MAG: PilZ domain-containing protein [Myxococcales bacterium]|nr:PilZ domain-containing protein [Myxococcales bacterium]
MPKRGELEPARKPKAPPPPPFEYDSYGGPEHRRFPRAKLAVRFHLSIGEGPEQRFSAGLVSANVSVSGAFLESTFFLPPETELRTSFQVDGANLVEARAVIVREERPDRRGEGRSGFAIRFLEFFGQTEVTLAKLFLGTQLLEFAQGYLQSKRARAFGNELERFVDALAAWELMRATAPGNVWGLRTE